jgi:hypothetical protein
MYIINCEVIDNHVTSIGIFLCLECKNAIWMPVVFCYVSCVLKMIFIRSVGNC